MNKKLMVLLSASGMALALAGCNTTQERVGGAGVGAVAGAAVGGPVGAVAGGVIGAASGPAVARETGVPTVRRTTVHRTKKRIRTRRAAEPM
jgi:osmotically inducible lipoprotein OsmB